MGLAPTVLEILDPPLIDVDFEDIISLHFTEKKIC